MMTSFESKAAKIINTFNAGNLSLWKFKTKIVVGIYRSSRHCGQIRGNSTFQSRFKSVKRIPKAHKKKTMSIIGLNLADNQFLHIKNCKGHAKARKILCIIYELKSLSNILFVCRKFFTYKMQEDNNLMKHINTIKALTNQLVCLRVPMTNEDIVIILLESLPTSYEYLIMKSLR
jgi:hypothetical protein